MNEKCHRIFKAWLKELQAQQLTDENYAHRVVIAVGFLKTHFKG